VLSTLGTFLKNSPKIITCCLFHSKVHSFLKQCLARSLLDTFVGYFRLIFELTSADISGKYPQIVSSEYFAKHNLKHKWTLRVPKMSINYKTPPILVLNLIKFLYTLFGCYLVFYEGIKVSRTVFGQIGQCAVCYSWADLLEVTCKQQATGSSRA
jgi:hypothetical protein